MPEARETNERPLQNDEVNLRARSGMPILLLNTALMLAALVMVISGIRTLANEGSTVLGITFTVAGIVYLLIVGPIVFAGLKVVKPQEALVMTLFGRYYGTLKNEGFFFVNPFVSAVQPPGSGTAGSPPTAGKDKAQSAVTPSRKRISLKTMTLDNERQKINDLLGNPIIIGIVVIWRVVNTAKALFNVDDYMEYLSIQCDSALRNIVRNYPYDTPGDDSEMSLRGSSQEVAEKLKAEIQEKVAIAGLEIMEARITHLAYAPEIAAAMLQRQQASAIIDARQMIVEGAVGMVEMALSKLNENDIVQLDEERKAAMVSNLLVVLCGNRDVQPVVNSGSLYS